MALYNQSSPEEQKAIRLSTFQNNPVAFGLYYLQEHFKFTVPNFHKELYQLGETEKRLAIAAPRSFAKSTIFSFVFPLYWALFGKRKDILILSSTYSLSEDWLRKIRFELDNNPFIHQDFGRVESTKWTDSHIILGNGSQIRAKGRGYQIRGFRPDVVIVDDIEDDEQVRSQEQREKLEEWFWKALLNTIEKESQIVVIGTLLHPLAFLTQLLENKTWTRRKYKAIENNKSLWPEKWPLEDLLKRKEEIGTLPFEAEFQNNPLAAVEGIWRAEWFKWFETRGWNDLYIITAVDPAISKQESADYTAINTLGIVLEGEEKGRIYNLEAKRGKWSLQEIGKELIDTWRKYNSQVIWLEEYGFQQAIRQYLDEECNRQGITLPIKRIELGRDFFKKAKDKVTRSISITYLAEQGKVYLQKGQKDLFEELIVFPYGDHDDLNDAFTYCLMVSQELERKGEIVGPKVKLGAVIGSEPSFEIAVKGGMPNQVWDFGKDEEWRNE